MKISRVFLTILLLFVFSVNNFAGEGNFLDGGEIEKKVEQMLEKRDLSELAGELARKKSGAQEDLLVKLSVFARAGHRARLHDALREIAEIYQSSPEKTQIYNVVRRAVNADDLTAQRIYYEQIATGGDDRTGTFVYLWREKGDARELENWLKARSEQNETWWHYWAELKKTLGTAGEVADLLERKIRQNPSDFYLIQKYLQIVSTGIDSSVGLDKAYFQERDVSWLAEIETTDSAYGAYELGTMLRHNNAPLAIRLFSKSLALPFAEKDLRLFGELAFRTAAITPRVKNPEKQLRFWTKRALAEIYQKNKQPELAQPLVEELTKMDTSDIVPENPFELAGAVQASSGARVVEAKILRDEAANENSPQYWLDRVEYYYGRKEEDLIWQTFQKALAKFPYQPNDWQASSPRLQILNSLSRFDKGRIGKESEGVLRRDLVQARTNKDAAYLIYLARLTDHEFEDLLDEFFVNTDLMPQVLSAFPKWRQEEEYLIINAMESDRWDAEKRAAIWQQLTEMARRDIAQRGYAMVQGLMWSEQFQKAIPFLEELQKIAPKNYGGGFNFIDTDIEPKLFEAYLEVNDWQRAEKMYRRGYRYWGDELGKIAAAAARDGKIDEAMRVWKTNANLDRRNLKGLDALAKTGAKPALQEFYRQLKNRDPLTDAPDKALAFLQ